MSQAKPMEISWFSALCDDDYEFFGVPDEDLQSNWLHCSDIVRQAEHNGFDGVLLPSGYALGIDATTFAAAISGLTTEINLLTAIRIGELVVHQLARQLATLQQISGSRMLVNAISSDLASEHLSSGARYRRVIEHIFVLGELMEGRSVNFEGEFLQVHLAPPKICLQSPGCPPIYFGGLSEAARDCAAACADVYLMWPDTTAKIAAIILDLTQRAQIHERSIAFGWRSHVIVRETEREARQAARRLMSRLARTVSETSRPGQTDVTATGLSRHNELRIAADDEGYLERNLWMGMGSARSGASVAIVGDPDQVCEKITELVDAGVSSFVLSGFPQIAECEWFSRLVLPQLVHAPLSLSHSRAKVD